MFQIFIVQCKMSNPKNIVSYLDFSIQWPLIVLETRYINHSLSFYCPWNDSFCQAWNDWMRASIVITLPLFYSQISLYCVGKPTIARLPYVQIYINTQHTLSTHNRRPWRLFISGIFAIFVLETRGTYRMWSSVNSFLFSLHILDKSLLMQ